MEQTSLISVIVPVYKVEAYLPRCVDSILEQTYHNLEILLVDDGSPDRCPEICQRYAEKDKRIRVIHRDNGGLSAARNTGIDAAAGEYLAFVDSDDWIVPEALEWMVTAAKAEKVKLVCAGRYDVDEGCSELVPGMCPPKAEVISGQELVSRIFRWNQVDSAAWDKLYHRDLFRRIRYPEGRICEDVPTTYRIALDAGNTAMLPKRVYCYFHRPNSITTASVSEKTFHFTEHARMVYEDIRANVPALEADAHYLYVRSLGYTADTLDLNGREVRKKYGRELRFYRLELLKNTPFWLLSSSVPLSQKRDFALTSLGWMRPAMKVHFFLKGLRQKGGAETE